MKSKVYLYLLLNFFIYFSQLKHRFSRMETHLTSLAKTVAQISVELKSIKSIEDVIYNLRKEVHELKTINLGRSSSALEKISDLHRTASEPTVVNSILNANGLKALNSNTTPTYSNSKTDNNLISKRQEFLNEKEKLKNWVPSYSNPRKLKKLTKLVELSFIQNSVCFEILFNYLLPIDFLDKSHPC